jgi:UDP-N-acetylmuramate dehydrogenase
MEILSEIPLAPYTTLGVGGPAKHFATARRAEDFVDLFLWADEVRANVFVLGGGSNILVSDSGFDGLVIKNEIRGVEFEEGGVVKVGAGEDWDAFVGTCISRGLAGIECLSGIPGTVGGTPVQNVGAYGQDVSETIVSVHCLDRINGSVADLAASECGFGYRSSIFNTTERERYVVLEVTFELMPDGPPKIAYKDLKERFDGRTPDLRDTREMVLTIRREKSMVIDPADPNSRSAGSFFKNPIIEASVADSIAEELEIDRVPAFPASDGHVKIPAAWLIEQAGFHKGFVLGNAGISSRHSLAIINRGGATAGEIVELKDLIQGTVLDRFGISLHPEPQFIGF